MELIKKYDSNYGLNDASHWEWHTTFIGQYMQHNYRTYCLLDGIFLQNPQIKSIVEIGTGAGALTVFLGLWAVKLKIPIISIDNINRHDADLFNFLKINFMNVDEFSDIAIQSVHDTVNNIPSLVICDGGYKEKEFIYWADKLPSGSIIAAHDWGAEFQISNITSTFDFVVPYLEDRWNEMNSQYVFFKVKEK